MKRSLLYVIIVVFVLSMASAAAALTHDYTNDPYPNVSINNDYDEPNASNWYELVMPDWYDSDYVTAFTIEMYGKGDDSGRPIDIWLKPGGASATPQEIVGFNVDNGTRRFTLMMNLMNMNLYRNYRLSNGSWTGYVDTGKNLNDISPISLASFDGLDRFFIGYACHFTLDKTTIHIEQSTVPEPATMLLLGFGLVGLAGARRKFMN